MATYAIGDIQGCQDSLRQLLARIGYDPDMDQLWLTGDLVNRGPQSLETLRFIRSLDSRAITVLGNHDLHLLAVAAGKARLRQSDMGIQQVLEAPDSTELLDWLRHRPLLHHDPALGVTMVHAGLAPQWDLVMAMQCSKEAESVLQGDNHAELLTQMYGDEPRCWDSSLTGWPRLRFIVNCLTRLRYCTKGGGLALEHKGMPTGSDAALLPWFQHPQRRTRGHKVLFGHWSTLGQVEWPEDEAWGLDTGCVWGGGLTAARIDQEPWQITTLPCPTFRKPGKQ